MECYGKATEHCIDIAWNYRVLKTPGPIYDNYRYCNDYMFLTSAGEHTQILLMEAGREYSLTYIEPNVI
jgi:hypothetical protein